MAEHLLSGNHFEEQFLEYHPEEQQTLPIEREEENLQSVLELDRCCSLQFDILQVLRLKSEFLCNRKSVKEEKASRCQLFFGEDRQNFIL